MNYRMNFAKNRENIGYDIDNNDNNNNNNNNNNDTTNK